MGWADFQKLGNPENAPDLPKEKTNKRYAEFIVRVHLEKKHRGGKTANVIKGLKMSQSELKEVTKALQKICGVGGSCKNGEIIIQGNQREKIVEYLKKIGCKDVKMAGG